MIVNPTSTGWEIIYHRAHALLAAQLAGQWRRKNAPPRLYETLAAISHHDDLEREWEGNHLTEVGTPLDFTLDQNFRPDKIIKHVESARYRGRWVALLTSIHLTRLNEVRRGKDEEFDRFLDEQPMQQQRWREELDLTQEDVEQAYAFFLWCDWLSLILCQRQLPADGRALEISKGPDGKRYDVVKQPDERLTVLPWPFEDNEFTVNVEACYLSQATFKNNVELTEVLQTAPIDLLEWTFVKM